MMSLAKSLKIIRFNKMKDAILMMQEYSFFEKQCNNKLRKMAFFIVKRADLLLKEGLTIWFQNTLKPCGLAK